MALTWAGIVVTAVCLSASSPTQTKSLHGTYGALWAETVWKYLFINRHYCNFYSRGHFGNTSTDCIYWISGDTVFLKSLPAGQQGGQSFMGIKDTLFIASDSCLLDKNKYFRYCIQSSDTLYSQD
jgi:hypothetical protein